MPAYWRPMLLEGTKQMKLRTKGRLAVFRSISKGKSVQILRTSRKQERGHSNRDDSSSPPSGEQVSVGLCPGVGKHDAREQQSEQTRCQLYQAILDIEVHVIHNDCCHLVLSVCKMN